MSNTHAIADTAYELQATCEDLLPACVISTTFPTVPVSSMTLAAFATQAYARDGQALVYIDQPAITLTLSGSAGTYWLAISRDVSTAYATWTRRAGSHYLWQLAGARPPDVDGVLVFSSVTVAGAIITAVTPAPGVTRAERWRTLAALGTLATQNANAVAITGGDVTGLASLASNGPTQLNAQVGIGTAPVSGQHLTTGTFPCVFGGVVGLRGVTVGNEALHVPFLKQSIYGLGFRQMDNDTGPFAAVLFLNQAGGAVGTILTSATATAYNTSSDARLKHAIAALTGALDVVAALRPVRFRWNADESQDEGFLAHELQQVLPHAVTGEPDAVHEDGSVRPQQVDHSKLVVWLCGAVQELAARVQSLEEQLGV